MQSPVDEIKAKLDIVDIIQEYFPLKQAGVNLKAKCPFHEEKTPSFMVSREKQFYHCFGCNEGGDMFEFIKKMENVEFPEALRILAKKAGVRLPEYNPEMTNLKTRLINIHEVAGEWLAGQLFNTEAGNKALNYLKADRGLEEKTIREWQLGYAVDSWETLTKYLKTKGFTDQEILQSGLVVQKQGRSDFYDRFRDRIMFPIVDFHGNVVGFTGRAMKADEPARYLNTPQTAIYNKSEVIFGLYQAKQFIKQSDKAVVVEGNMDVIASGQAGVKNVVAVSGTALTEEQIKAIQRLTNNIIFCFDSDEAGRRAVERSIRLAWQKEANVQVIDIDENWGKDPDEVIRRDVKLWQELIDKAELAMDYFFTVNFKEYNPESVESKKNTAKSLLNYIIQLANPVEQDFYLKKLAEKINVAEESLRETVNKAKTGGQKFKDNRTGGEVQLSNVKNKIDKKRSVAERVLALLLLKDDYLEYISENLLIEYLPPALQNLYKLIIVYYTKRYNQDLDDKNLFAFIEENGPDFRLIIKKLVLLGGEELEGVNDNEIIIHLKQDIFFLKKEFIRDRLREIENNLKQVEIKFKNAQKEEDKKNLRKKMDQLLNQFTQLSTELKEVDI